MSKSLEFHIRNWYTGSLSDCFSCCKLQSLQVLFSKKCFYYNNAKYSINIVMQARVIVVRHGLTDLNVHHVVQGHLNCSLNEEGREQAVSLGRHFTAVGTTLSLVYSSDLLRAVETAELIISCQKFAKDLQIVPDPRLRERVKEEEAMNNNREVFFEEHLLYLIYRFLSMKEGLGDAADALGRSLETAGYIPLRFDYQGVERRQTLAQFHSIYASRICDDHLPVLLENFIAQTRRFAPAGLTGPLSLLDTGPFSMLRADSSSILQRKWRRRDVAGLRSCMLMPVASNLKNRFNLADMFFASQVSSANLMQQLSFRMLFPKFHLQAAVIGHLASVCCVTFDRTGRRLFTGGDDHLIKVWSPRSARLLYTFRGFCGQITDMHVNYENTLIAAASMDKFIRVWSLKNAQPVAAMTGHTGMITNLQFLPSTATDRQVLVSTGNDGNVFFWHYMHDAFEASPVRFNVRSKVGGRVIGLSVSGGGRFVGTCGSDHSITVFKVPSDGEPEMTFDIAGHSDRIDCIQWAHTGLRFATCSKDGLAKIWKYQYTSWNPMVLDPSLNRGAGETTRRLSMLLCTWNADDTLLVTSSSDNRIRVWDSTSGQLVRTFDDHTNDVQNLIAHPADPDLMVTAGDDGQVIFWNLAEGVRVNSYLNKRTVSNHDVECSVYEGCFSPDGFHFAAVDSLGSTLFFGLHHEYPPVPGEQFFHTDYRPLLADEAEYVVDEQTQLPPHLMPPPFLVNAEGEPYPPAEQRFVPGKEHCSEQYLVPELPLVSEEAVASAGPSRFGFHLQADPNRQLFCCWTSRHLVPALDADQLTTLHGRIVETAHQEEELFLKESSRHLPTPRAESPSVTADSTPRVVETAASERDSRRFRVDDIDLLADESTDDDDYDPDYTEGGIGSSGATASAAGVGSSGGGSGTVAGDVANTRSLRTRSSARRRRGRRTQANLDRPSLTNGSLDDSTARSSAGEFVYLDDDNDEDYYYQGSSDNDEDEEDDEEDVDLDDDDDDEDEDDDWYSDMSMVNVRSESDHSDEERVARHNNNNNNNSQRDSRRRGRRPAADGVASTEASSRPSGVARYEDLLSKFHFSDWITSTTCRPSPYFPQQGDEVVYFHQGHRMYVDEVKRANLYKLKEKDLPWNSGLRLEETEFAVVKEVTFHLHQVRSCRLQLTRINPRSSAEQSSFTFHVCFHDIPNVIDFIVLRQLYDSSIRRRWRIRWENDDEDRLSPWDLVPLEVGNNGTGDGEMFDLTEAASIWPYTPKTNEWPSRGRDAECQRLLVGLETISSQPFAEPFLEPVDLGVYPWYCMCIEYPCDLATIKARLANRFYRRVAAVKFDVERINQNACTFNEPNSTIVHQARLLTNVLLAYISMPNCFEIDQLYQEFMDQTADGAAADSTSTLNNGFFINDQPGPSGLSQQQTGSNWIERCQTLLQDIFRANDESQSVKLGRRLTLTLLSIQRRLNLGHLASPGALEREMDAAMGSFSTRSSTRQSISFVDSLYAKFKRDFEPNYGRFDGQPFANLMEASRARNVKPEHFDGEGVEPLPLFDARVREWFESMCEATLVNYDKTVKEEPNFRPTILVVSHGGTIRRLFAHFFSPELMMSGSFCPASRGAAMRIAANTAYSTFDLHLNLDVSDRGLQCLRLHLVSCLLFYWKLQFQTLLISCPASGKCSFLWHCVEIDAFSPTVSYCTSWSFRKKMATRRGEAKFSITKLIESASLENTPVVGRQSVAFLLKLFPNCKNSQALSTEAAAV
ncbi:Bromodomain and WD repeat-containing protein 3 [Trichinella patagoniensis]|uniref:Bromodomain and WD repeat-containing protein 3 n=1 Tax=Trichinella patagoniensis TaxID=990121 RepID=A0A0V0ZGE2_9BILA|nr:Bromodomain and WD repeat-containing protein 3 [Trichinella patagoniensis]KRY11437.1 Bromodomain and WD repeat-containing protein 3 [Trichinella patagoniensis]